MDCSSEGSKMGPWEVWLEDGFGLSGAVVVVELVELIGLTAGSGRGAGSMVSRGLGSTMLAEPPSDL